VVNVLIQGSILLYVSRNQLLVASNTKKAPN
jgi:hypothetical protein